MKYARAVVVLIGVLSALWLTFVHPPLVLTAGPGDYADARAHCTQTKKEYIQREHTNSSGSNSNWLNIENPFTASLPDEEYKRCMSNASVRIPHLLLQLAVIVLSTAALLWATRFPQ